MSQPTSKVVNQDSFHSKNQFLLLLRKSSLDFSHDKKDDGVAKKPYCSTAPVMSTKPGSPVDLKVTVGWVGEPD